MWCLWMQIKQHIHKQQQQRQDQLKQRQFLSGFRFPYDNDEYQHWIDVIGKINASLIVNNETVIRENHWSTGYETIKKGRYRPKYPPCVF